MAISDAARTNHDELFGDHVSALAQTDPEFIEFFDNFAFDETIKDAGLDIKTRLMVQLASLIALQAQSEFRIMASAALANGVSPVELKEIVYQAVSYVGLGKVFDFLHSTNELLVERGVELPLAAQSTSTPETRFEVGLATQKRVVGSDAVDARLRDAPVDEAHFNLYLAANCFGDHLSRSGIELANRELLTFSMLVSLGGADSQVRGHVAGNLNVGNDRAKLLSVLTVLVPFIGYPRTLNGLAAINDITR